MDYENFDVKERHFLSRLIYAAIGVECSIFASGSNKDVISGQSLHGVQFQIVPKFEKHSPESKTFCFFYKWYEIDYQQYYASPLEAALKFIAYYLAWLETDDSLEDVKWGKPPAKPAKPDESANKQKGRINLEECRVGVIAEREGWFTDDDKK